MTIAINTGVEIVSRADGQLVSPSKKPIQTAHMGLVSVYSSKNVGVRAISSSLREAGIKVDTIFFKELIASDSPFPTEKEYDLLIGLLKDLNVNIAGLSIICSSCQSIAIKITNRIKKELGIPVVWGGPHASLLTEESLQYADLVCHGEGDIAIVDLIRQLEAGEKQISAKNIWSKCGDSIVRTESYPLMDLDPLPYPDFYQDRKYYINHNRIFHQDPFHLNPDIYSLITSKGCQFHCTFCETNSFEEGRGNRIDEGLNAEGLRFRKPGQIRQKSPSKVIEEIKRVLEMGAKVRFVEFMDDEFSYSLPWVEEFSALYKKEINLPFWCQFHPHSVSNDIIKNLKHAGLFYVNMGLQTGSERVRRKILGRPETDVDFRGAVSKVHAVNIIPKIDLIFDNPYETQQDKEDAINYFLTLPKPFHFRIMSLCYFPGTKLTERALRDGYITEQEVEGNSTKTFNNMFVNTNQGRPPSELFWILLSPLAGSPLVPRFVVRWMVKHKAFFIKNVNVLIPISHLVHILGMVEKGWNMFIRGQITFALLKNYSKYLFKISS